MKSAICPACGCSLVRLGVARDRAVVYQHNGEEYLFCCKGCLDIFITDPERYTQEVNNLAVCPTCLAEKLLESTIELEYNATILHFCRCPHCVEEFKESPEYYIKRLTGEVHHTGVFGDKFCCNE